VLYLILVVGGLIVGFVTGRLWALAAAGALAVWTATASEVDEVPGWYLGLAYGLLSGAGVVVGVLARRSLRKAAEG
jgi:hypothetical protein